MSQRRLGRSAGAVCALCAVALAAAAPPVPECGPEALAILEELNAARLEEGAVALRPHRALCLTAGERVQQIVRQGATDQGVRAINRRTRSLYRKGYAAHAWSEAAIIGGGDESVLEQFRAVRPDWHRVAVSGDFEEAGAATATLDGRPVYAILLALPLWSVEWRQAEPLRDLEWVRAEILAAVNRARAARGRDPVTLDQRLNAAAQSHATDMLRGAYYDHRSPDGTKPAKRARAAGYPRGRSIAENIAKGPFTPSEVVERWMNSSGHRRNILRRGAVAMGAGVAFGENVNGFEVLWVQLFAGR